MGNHHCYWKSVQMLMEDLTRNSSDPREVVNIIVLILRMRNSRFGVAKWKIRSQWESRALHPSPTSQLCQVWYLAHNNYSMKLSFLKTYFKRFIYFKDRVTERIFYLRFAPQMTSTAGTGPG